MRHRTFLFTAATLAASLASGATYTWDNSAAPGISDGSGTWDTSTTSWTTDGGATDVSYGNLTTDAALIGSGGAGDTIAVGAINVNSLTFGMTTTAGYTLAGGTLTLSDATPTITNNNTAFTTVIGSTLAGTSGITFAGTGATSITGTGSFSGPLTVNGGTVAINSGDYNMSGAVINAGATLVAGVTNSLRGRSVTVNGGTLTTSDGVTTNINDITLNGGTLSSGAVDSYYPAFVINGTVTVAGSAVSTINAINIGFGTAGGTVFNVADVTGDAASDLVISGAIINRGGDAGFIKNGAGTMELQAGGAANGPVTINAGTVLATTDNAVRYNSVITINAGGTLTTTNGSSHILSLVMDGGTLSATTARTDYSNWNLDGGITTSGLGTHSTISGGNVALSQSGGTILNVGSGDILEISSAISHNGGGDTGLVKNGAGTLLLSGVNVFTGGTTVNAGTLIASTPNGSTYGALGAGNIIVNAGGTISVDGDNSLNGQGTGADRSVTINSGGVVNSANGSSGHLNAVVLNGGTLSADTANGDYGNWNLDFGVSTAGNGTTSYISGGNIVLTQSGGTVFDIGAGDTVKVSAVIDELGSTTLIKNGAGTLVLTGANTHASGITINAGTLVTGNISAFGASTVTLTAGVLQIGDGTTSTVTLGAGANLVINGGTLKLDAMLGTSTAAIALSGGSYSFNGTLDLSGVFDAASAGSYTLITGGTGNTDTSVTIAGFTHAGYAASFANGMLVLTAVPEPSTYGLLGAGALAGVALIRRRKRA